MTTEPPTSPPSEPPTRQRGGLRRWFGPSAFVALGVVLLGRLALEPVRSIPQYDDYGMAAFGATEKFNVQRPATPIKIAFFGSSQSGLAIIPEVVEAELNLPAGSVRNCSTAGGTVFEMAVMLRRNPALFENLDLAVLEMNPFIMHRNLEDDQRQRLSFSQHASLHERLLLMDRQEMLGQLVEWAYPWRSVRRNAHSLFLGLLQPEPGNPIYPQPERRATPPSDWFRQPGQPRSNHNDRLKLSAPNAAKRFMGKWKLSLIQDRSLRSMLDWFAERKIPVVFHQPPVDPEVAEIILTNSELQESAARFHAYISTLKPAPLASVIVLSPTDFGCDGESMSDRTHLTKFGAERYCKFLTPQLRLGLAAGESR